MSTQARRAVWLLGLCQCVLWGVLYYGFSVLLIPMEHTLSLSRTAVAGAFSAALLTMALMAPAVGRWLDGGHARQVIRLGAALAVGGLLLIATAQGIVFLYVGWLAIGAAMAMLLYESAFALVIRAVEEHLRLRALAAVTVMGGLASTIFVPLLSLAIEHLGWRTTGGVCIGAILLAAWVLDTQVLPAFAGSSPPTVAPRTRGGEWPPHLRALVGIFAVSTLAGMAMTTLLIPMLIERGVAPTVAALVLAALGIAQLPGRLWVLRGGQSASSKKLKALPITLQVIGLGVIALAPGVWMIGVGVALFGLGAGLQTLARPWLVQAIYGTAEAGRWNGEIARAQGFARAAGPVAAAASSWWIGAPGVLVSVGALLLMTLPLARKLPA